MSVTNVIHTHSFIITSSLPGLASFVQIPLDIADHRPGLRQIVSREVWDLSKTCFQLVGHLFKICPQLSESCLWNRLGNLLNLSQHVETDLAGLWQVWDFFVADLSATWCRPAQNLVGDLVLSKTKVIEFQHFPKSPSKPLEITGVVFLQPGCSPRQATYILCPGLSRCDLNVLVGLHTG